MEFWGKNTAAFKIWLSWIFWPIKEKNAFIQARAKSVIQARLRWTSLHSGLNCNNLPIWVSPGVGLVTDQQRRLQTKKGTRKCKYTVWLDAVNAVSRFSLRWCLTVEASTWPPLPLPPHSQAPGSLKQFFSHGLNTWKKIPKVHGKSFRRAVNIGLKSCCDCCGALFVLPFMRQCSAAQIKFVASWIPVPFLCQHSPLPRETPLCWIRQVSKEEPRDKLDANLGANGNLPPSWAN